MYKVTRFYSSVQNTTIVELESKSVDTSDYENYVKTLAGDYSNISDDELIKIVLDKVRIKLNPNEAVVNLDVKVKELDELIEASKEQMVMSQMAIVELMEVVYGLLDMMYEEPAGDSELPQEPEGDPELPVEPEGEV